MSKIDKRVVDMQFNNKQFEEGIKSSLKALGKLKDGLKLDSAAKSLTNLEKVGKAFSLEGITKAVKNAGAKFADLAKTGAAGFKNIKDSASQFGEHVSSIFDKLKNKDASVSAKFDTKQFEAGISTAGQMIDKFASGAASDLGEIDRASKGFDFSSMSAGIDHIASKFNALSVVAITALSNITTSVMNTGSAMVKSFTIDPIQTGLSEYETKINSIQTILTNTASKGTTIDQVTDALNELNKYSDQTIYNFTEMARNIGTFTAAGVDLDTSVSSIKGIANLAAGSGSSAQQASTAMYQLSQAIASGSVKLMDWNSVVNAGMGGELFRNALLDTAKGMGVVVDASIPFRESLESGWLTTDILTTTLNKFANDQMLIDAATKVKTFTQLIDVMKESVQSGWAQSWEMIIGNKDEAIDFFTPIYNGFNSIVGASADARNATLKFWKDNGGRAALIEGLGKAFEGLQSVMKPIGEAFREVFPAVTGERLIEVSKKFKEMMENFKIGEGTAANLKSTFKGLFAVLDIGKQLFQGIITGIGTVIQSMLPVSDGILGITGSFGEYLVALDESIKKTGIFKAFFETVGTIFAGFAEVIKAVVQTIKDALASIFIVDTSTLDGLSSDLNAKLTPFEAVKTRFSKIFGGMAKVANDISPAFVELGKAVAGAFKVVIDYFTGLVDNFDSNTLLALINGTIFVALAKGLKNITAPLEDIAKTGSGFIGTIKGVLDEVRTSLVAYQANLKADILLKIAVAIGVLAASLVLLSGIDPEKLSNALAAVTIMFTELFGTMFLFEKSVGLVGFGSLGTIAAAFGGMAISILILAAALKIISTTDWDGLIKGMLGIGALMAMLTATAKALTTYGGITRGLGQLILFAAAISLLALVVKRLGDMDFDDLAKGLGGVGILMLEIGLFMKYAEASGVSVKGSIALIGIAAAISILASAVERFGEMDPVKLAMGLGAMAIVLGEIVAFIKLTGDGKMLISTAIALTILGVAVNLFARAIGVMGVMKIEDIGKGLLALGGALAIVAGAMWIMPKDMMLKSVALIGVSIAINLLAKALLALGQMKLEEIGKGLLAIGGMLAILAAAMWAMTTALPGAAALLIIAGALALLVPIFKILGSMPIEAIGLGLLALAGIFVVIGLAGLVLEPLAPTLVILAAAIALLGLACMAVGTGLAAFATGLGALVAVGSTGVNALISIVKAIIDLIPYTLTKFGEGLIAFAKVVGEGAPVVAKSFFDLIMAILKTLKDTIPTLIDTMVTLVLSMLKALSDGIPKLIETGCNMIIGVLKGIAKMLPKVIQAAIDVILAFTNGLADGIRNNTDAMIAAMKNLISAIVEAGLKMFREAIPNFAKAGVDAVAGFLKGLGSKNKDVAAAGSKIMSTALTATRKTGDIQSPSKEFAKLGAYSAEGFIQGINRMGNKVAAAGSGISQTAMDSLRGALAKAGDAFDMDPNLTPTIRPVIDMSDVKDSLATTFAEKQGITVDAAMVQTGRVAAKYDSSGNTINNNAASIQISNTYNVRSDSDIRKISADLKNTLDRYNLAKGVPVV